MWTKELEVASEAAKVAGEILKQKFGAVSDIRKKGAIDLVTEADLQAEKAILNRISRYFPQDRILAEEAGTRGAPSERVWLIDPLDGTTNFTHGFPFFGVSIALEVEGRVVLGIVCNPYLDEHFLAVEDSGAFLNQRPIRVSNAKHIGDALLATGFPYDIQEDSHDVLEKFGRMLVKAQGIRRPGSAALDLCYLACGRIDGFWEQGLHPWDTAAGCIIVKEAGGLLSTFQGTEYTPYEKSIVAANSFLLGDMIKILDGKAD